MKSFKLPKTVFIVQDSDGYLLCFDSLEEAVESQGLHPTIVGTYTLAEQTRWKLVAQREELDYCGYEEPGKRGRSACTLSCLCQSL